MISSNDAFVWIWLPNEVEPVVAGRLVSDGVQTTFNYGKSYLDRGDSAIPIYQPELPLQRGVLPLLRELTMPGCIRDASPDAWGRRVIINKLAGQKFDGIDIPCVDELTYLLESGSDRIGAMDFQRSPTEYIPRLAEVVPLEELLDSAKKVEQGLPLNPELDRALVNGCSIGGARPKALIAGEDGKKYVAKFSASGDVYSVVKAEFIAMRLAEIARLNVAPVKIYSVANKDILLVERFDRKMVGTHWSRELMVSALTLFELDETMTRYASYEVLTRIIRARFVEPRKTLKELFSRLVFNVLCGNTDDHARNHAAFWDGEYLELTPAYDICPQLRSGQEASQAMLIVGDVSASKLANCRLAAPYFGLSADDSEAIINNLQDVIRNNFRIVCEEAELNKVDQRYFWERQFLNPFIHFE